MFSDPYRNQVLIIFAYSLITALACWLGSVPFFFIKNISKKWVGIAQSIAAWLMIAASFGMINEWVNHSLWWVLGWIVIGMLLIMGAKKFVHAREDSMEFGEIKGKSAGQMLLILSVMTIHSWTEWIAMWFAFGPSWKLWLLVALVMAIQNIPEWLAIGSVMVPKWVSPRKAVWWSIFSSLPQPLLAVPAFLFVSMFQPLVSWGLGFAAWAMLWMSFSELLPEAINDTPSEYIATIATLSIALMVLVEHAFA